MNDLSEKLIETMKTNITDLTIDISEMKLDSILNNGMIKDLPIIKYLYSGCKFILDVRDYFFIKKLSEFLNQLSSIPLEERVQFLSKKGSDEHKLGERLLMLIERSDSLDKPVLIARLFRAYLYEKIDINLFNRLCNIVERTYIQDIYFLRDNYSNHDFSGFEALGLSNNGLAIRYTYDGWTLDGKDEIDDDTEIKYKITKLGKQLIENLFS